VESEQLGKAIRETEALPAAVGIGCAGHPEVRAEPIIPVHDAGEHAGIRVLIAGASGILERAPGDLQEQTQLRIHEFGFPRRDAKERGVELRGFFNQSRPVRSRIRERLQEPVAIVGHGTNTAPPLAQQIP